MLLTNRSSRVVLFSLFPLCQSVEVYLWVTTRLERMLYWPLPRAQPCPPPTTTSDFFFCLCLLLSTCHELPLSHGGIFVGTWWIFCSFIQELSLPTLSGIVPQETRDKTNGRPMRHGSENLAVTLKSKALWWVLLGTRSYGNTQLKCPSQPWGARLRLGPSLDKSGGGRDTPSVVTGGRKEDLR